MATFVVLTFFALVHVQWDLKHNCTNFTLLPTVGEEVNPLSMDDFRADAQTGHVIHETPKRFWRIFKNEKKNSQFYFDALYWGRGVEPVCLLSRGLCSLSLSLSLLRVCVCVSLLNYSPIFTIFLTHGLNMKVKNDTDNISIFTKRNKKRVYLGCTWSTYLLLFYQCKTNPFQN